MIIWEWVARKQASVSDNTLLEKPHDPRSPKYILCMFNREMVLLHPAEDEDRACGIQLD